MQSFTSADTAQAVGPYSPAVLYNNTLYVSGQIGLNKEGELRSTLEDQVAQIFKNLDNLLSEANTNKSKIMKMEIFLTNMKDFQLVNELYLNYFLDVQVLPARTTVEVSALPKGALIEMSAIAHI